MIAIDWLTTAHAALAAAEGDLRAIAAAQLSLGLLHWRQGHHHKAIDPYTPALERYVAELPLGFHRLPPNSGHSIKSA